MLVTGGAGFIGSHVVERALAGGWEVAALDNLSSGKRENLPLGVSLYEIDVRNPGAVSAAFQEFQPVVVSHQAAQASVSVSVREPVLDAEINIIGGINVLRASLEVGTQRIVFASTGGAIYGEVPVGAADETAAARPYSPYATSKLSFEYYLETFRQQFGLDYVSLRYANVYGPRQNPHGEAGVVAIFADRLLAGQPININAMKEVGDDGCVRDYVYAGDVAEANLAAAEGRTPRLLNIGTGKATTTRELAEQLASALGVQAELQAAPPRVGDLQRSVLDVQQAEGVLGQPLTLKEGLRRTAEWARSRR
ncbi:NAD-dependent epimerase/dehydratase family protein [Deinococcus hopiensis]|uniref:UDP-glucose 4-epimerase n=1 Tax=Deinococcus hopiensis KR-140 TaxID=695939 RepID=A0A1W1UHC7_9DEIO|nr:NAD-dependent epimerase/dehydratase family protein [Deinococcus hopiensis]SMB80477.1 UDP-glucose 4-epimerase [Deinococcus hopiensis KR-140]